MQKDSAPDPDEASARHHCLHKGIEAPDLATVKDFLRFYIATSRDKIVEKPTLVFRRLRPYHGHIDR
jgi:hypothetical protein